MSRKTLVVHVFASMVAVACLALAATSASADGQSADADDEAVASFRLDDEVMRHYTAALNNLVALQKAHPEIVEQVNGSSQNTLAEAVAWINRFAAYRDGITRAGMTVRDYMLCAFATVNAGASAASVQAAGAAGWKAIPAGVATDNVRYFLAHQAKFDAINELNGRLNGGGLGGLILPFAAMTYIDRGG